ncbi:hypothetical protein IAE22_28735, partial [Bacillus sp. S34]|nr:hypothetical protein [Bacillus sp. S34]
LVLVGVVLAVVVAHPLGQLALALGGALANAVIAITPALMELLPVVVQLIQQLGGAFLGILTALTPVFNSVAMIASELVIALTPIAGVLGQALVSALIAVLPLITGFSNILAPLTGYLADNSSMVTTLAVAIGGGVLAYKAWIVVSKAWTVATKVAAGAQMLFNGALRANPIGLIITAVSAAIGISATRSRSSVLSLSSAMPRAASARSASSSGERSVAPPAGASVGTSTSGPSASMRSSGCSALVASPSTWG